MSYYNRHMDGYSDRRAGALRRQEAPELGKGLGEGLRGFKDGMKGVTDDVNKTADTANTAPKPKKPQIMPPLTRGSPRYVKPLLASATHKRL